MKANPGGQIDSSEVVGRDELIEQIWDTLDQQSIRMNAERRIGKTTIIKKLCAEPRSGWVPIFQDLEQYPFNGRSRFDRHQARCGNDTGIPVGAA